MQIIVPRNKEIYKHYIDRILSSRENKRDKDNYQERHHIIPKTLGGNNNADNLIYLYAQEHYYAHKLLALENPHENGLQLAWWNMCQCTKGDNRIYHITAEDYAEARGKAAKATSEIRKGMEFTEEHKNHLCGHGKPVVNITTGVIYSSAKEAFENTGISASKIGECCKGKIGSAGRDTNTDVPYIWRYKGEEDKDFGFKIFYFQKQIICVETGKIYESIREAYRDTGVARTTIQADCQNNRSKHKKNRLHFAYYNNEMNDSNK